MLGFVSYWKTEKGWGWICDYSGNKFFTHITGLKAGLAPKENDSASFEIKVAPRGPMAVNVEILKDGGAQ